MVKQEREAEDLYMRLVQLPNVRTRLLSVLPNTPPKSFYCTTAHDPIEEAQIRKFPAPDEWTVLVIFDVGNLTWTPRGDRVFWASSEDRDEIQVSLCSSSFTWTIPNFYDLDRTNDGLLQSSRVKGSESEGPEFSVAIRPWGFYRFRNNDPEEDEHVAVLLRVHNVEGKSYNIRYYFSILEATGNKFCSTQDEKTITMEGESFGNHSFIRRNDLLRHSEVLLPDGKLTIYVEVVIMNALGGALAAERTAEHTQSTLQEPLEELPRDLWKLYKSGNYADRCFVVDGVKMMAHSAILAARSPEVSKLFADGSNEVVIQDIKPEVFECVLQAIYTETMIQNLEERAEDLLMASNVFGLNKLKQRAETTLIQNIAVHNVARFLIMSFQYDAPNLKDCALRYLIDNKKAVKGSSGWRNLSKYPEIMFELFASI